MYYHGTVLVVLVPTIVVGTTRQATLPRASGATPASTVSLPRRPPPLPRRLHIHDAMQESEAIALLIDVYFERRGVEPALIPGSGPTKMAGSGTTTTESSREDGTFAKPVYYDWSTDWPRVKALFDEPATQRLLHLAIAHDRGEKDWGVAHDPNPQGRRPQQFMPYSEELKAVLSPG